MRFIIFVLLPALGYASITVDIQAAQTYNQSITTALGEDSSVVTDQELALFYLTDSFLKKAAGEYSGGIPTDVFVKSPTPWGDLYKTYNWTEVRRETKVELIAISSISTIEVVLAVRQFTNNGSKDAIYENKIIAEDIENTVKKTFIGKKMAVDVKYNISLLVKDHPVMHIKFESGFANEETKIKDHKKLEARDVKITVKPNQVVKVFVNATLVILDVLVNYESSLNGHVAANYEPRYKGHHFWAYDVKEVMKKGVHLVWRGSDMIKVKYHTNAKVTAIDAQSGSTIYSEDAQFADYSTVQNV